MAEHLLSVSEAKSQSLYPSEDVLADTKRQNLGMSRDCQPPTGVGSELAVINDCNNHIEGRKQPDNFFSETGSHYVVLELI